MSSTDADCWTLTLALLLTEIAIPVQLRVNRHGTIGTSEQGKSKTYSSILKLSEDQAECPKHGTERSAKPFDFTHQSIFCQLWNCADGCEA